MHLKIITQNESPIKLGLVKDYLRIDHDEEDEMISTMLFAAIDYAEKFIRRSIIKKEYELITKGNSIKLPNPPIIEVKSVTVDGEDVEFEFEEPNHLKIDNFGKVIVRYEAGYDELPKAIEQALLMLTSHYYENREIVIVGTSVIRIPFTVESLLYPYKSGWF